MPVDVSELVALAADLGEAPARLGKEGAKVVRDVAEQVKSTAASSAPKRTGALANSIQVITKGSGRAAQMSALIKANIRYAGFVEFGTYKDAPQPFMAPAGDAAVAALSTGLEVAAEAAING